MLVGTDLSPKRDAVEMMHVGVHLVYCCLCLKREMRIKSQLFIQVNYFG